MPRLDVLRRNRDFRLLYLATLGSGFGTYLAAVALAVDVYDRTGSGGWVAALLIVDFLPMVVLGLVLGPLVDRLQRRRLMVASDLLRLGVFAALPFVGSPLALVALAGVAGFATGFFRPAVYAGLPNLVDDDDLASANSLLQASENLAWMLGPLAAGGVLAVADEDAAYWLNAATFLVGAALIARIPVWRLQSDVPLTKGHWRDVAEGIGLVLGSRTLLAVLVAWSVVIVGNAGVNVSEVVLAKDALGAGDTGFAILVGASGVGLTLGSLVAAGLVDRRGVRGVYAAGIAVMAAGFGAAAAAPALWVATVLVMVGTLGNGAALVCNALLVQRGAPDRLRGRAFTVIMSVNYALLGLGMAVAGPLTDALGARWLWAGSAALFALAAALALALTPLAPSDPE